MVTLKKWCMRGLRLAYTGLILCLPVAAVANYTATQGAGTSFGSVVIAGVHFMSLLICDATTANQCAAVNGSGQVAIQAPPSLPLPTGAATSALQTTGNTTLTTINTTLGSPMQNSGGSVTANLGTLNGAATAANQTTANTSLATIATNTGAAPAPYAKTYNTIAASQTAQALTGGGGGATGDYLSQCVVTPVTTSPGVVTILDNSTTIFPFAGGSSSLSNLAPFTIPVGAVSTSGAWKVTTGANVSVVCVGKFS